MGPNSDDIFSICASGKNSLRSNWQNSCPSPILAHVLRRSIQARFRRQCQEPARLWNFYACR